MLAKKFRLPIQEFHGKSGRSVRQSHFLLKIFHPEKAYARFGIVISKKVAAKASARNRLKRSIFNFIRIKFQEWPINDYLIILSPVAAKSSQEELLASLYQTLNPKT